MKDTKLIEENKKTYNKIAKDFSASRSLMWSEIEKLANTYLKNHDKILDIGCGNGRLLTILDSTKDFSYTGIDFSKELTKIAKEKFKEKNIDFFYGNMLDENLFTKESFDMVFAIASLNHLPNKILQTKALQNIYKSLKPEGILISSNWNMWNLQNKKSIWYNFWKNKNIKNVKTNWQSSDVSLYYHLFTKKSLEKLFIKSGFKILESYYNSGKNKSNLLYGKNIITVGKKKNP